MLMVNQLIGFGAGGGIKPSYTYNAAAVSASNLTTYTFSGISIGAVAGRSLVVITGYASSASLRDVSSATIGGISATIVVSELLNNTTDPVAFILSAVVPTGTTADVVVTFAGTMDRCGIHSYSIYGLGSTTAIATAGDSADPTNINMNTVADAIIIATSGEIGSATAGWTGVTEDAFSNVEGTVDFSSASAIAASAETPRTIECDWTGAASFVATAGAVWR